MMKMQTMLDKSIQKINFESSKIRFINGDCTKWSAAETMGSFLSMVEGFKEDVPKNMFCLLQTVFCTWGNKEIQIPLSILNKVIPSKEKNSISI